MTRTETIQIMAILKAAYPAFYARMPQEELNGAISVWQDAFSDIPSALAAAAVKSLIRTHSGYPPDIASVHAEIRNITDAASGEPTDEELWQIYKRAVQNSGYCENETFDKLPPILRQYCGSARTLYEHAMMSLDVFNSVLHGQFLKQLPVMRQRQEYRDSLPEGMRQLVEGLTRQKALPPAEKKPTPQELNSKRNEIVSQLTAPPPKSEYVPPTPEEKERRRQELLKRLEGEAI